MSDRGGDPDRDLDDMRLAADATRRRSAFAFARAGPGLALATRASAVRLELALIFEREMEAGAAYLWLPVLAGIGVLLYFALPREPSAIALIGLSAGLVYAGRRSRQRIATFRLLVALAAIAIGATLMKLRTEHVAAPRIPREMTAKVTGWLAGREEAGRGAERLLVRVGAIAGLTPDETPALIRVTARGASGFSIGDALALTARLQPPAGPVMPGGYDFARAAFYQGIGAIGFSYGAPKPGKPGAMPLDLRLARPLETVRDIIRRRILESLPGDDGHVAVALIIGEQGGVAEKTQDAMRASGLGHALSISGLHMALVGGSAFWLIRALLALSVRLALTRPIRKWAALGGLAVATIYLGISGGGVATVRSYVMLAVMFVAILIDRRAITLRNVATGALIVLAFMPESLLSPGFQMSFAATIALVVGYQAATAFFAARRGDAGPAPGGAVAFVRRYASGLVLTSLIAGLATTPFGIYHFQRLAPLTLIANAAAIPVFGALVMPAALAAVVLMPFGLEILPLSLMRYGIDWFVAVAEKTASWTGDAGGVAAIPAAALLLAVAGFLWLSLWRERWRLAGLLPIAAALPIAAFAAHPDILIAESGDAVAVRGDDGLYRIIGEKSANFEIENWLRADGDPRKIRDPTLRADTGCDPLGCILTLAGGAHVAFVKKTDAFAEDCANAVVVATALAAPPVCAHPGPTPADATAFAVRRPAPSEPAPAGGDRPPKAFAADQGSAPLARVVTALVIDRAALRRYGAHALYRQATGPPDTPRFAVETAYPAIRRPFMPAAPGEGQ